jgi:hypothetical protein
MRATNAAKESKAFWAEDWAKKLPKSTQKTSGVKGQMNKEGAVLPLNEKKQLPQADNAKSDYFKVYESAKKEAEDAVAKEQIPHGYQKQVKDYFESLNPTK